MVTVRVQPGELYLARSPAILQTILGSCVSATFWVPRLAAGALCHGVLPLAPPGATAPGGYRYVDFSIRYLAAQMDQLGVPRDQVQVKLFGGADVLAVPAARTGKPTVGALNCQAAWQILEQQGLTVLASDLGGTQGRAIRFHTGTGEVLVQRLARSRAPDSHAE